MMHFLLSHRGVGLSFLELVAEVSIRTGMSQRKVCKIIRALIDETSETIKAGERVVLPGLGVFYPHETKARPIFGGTRSIVEKKRIRFRPSRTRSK
jgi:nucleoid DNA-binding protein